MNWLITGGCGFVGSNLAYFLLDTEDVIIIDNLSRTGSARNLAWLMQQGKHNLRFIQADVRYQDTISRIIQETQPEVIAHLAGQVAMTTSLENPRLDFEVNAWGTMNILEAVRLHSPTSIVLYSSTNKVYGALQNLRYQELETRYILPDYPDGLGENHPIEGHSPYGCSKLAAEQYVHDYHRMYGIPTIVFRHSSIYGGRQFATYDQGWIGWFCQKALEMEDINTPAFSINGNGKQVRDVLHAEDLVQAYMLAVKNSQTTVGEIYNLGGGVSNSISLLELFNFLKVHTGYAMRFYCGDWRPGDQKVFIADNSKATQGFGWAPRVSKEDGLVRMLSWSREINCATPDE